MITTAEQYPSDVKFSALKEKSDQLNGIAEGDKVNVKFDVKGREYNDRYYVDLNAWRIEKMGAEGGAPADQGGQAAPAAAEVPPAPAFNPGTPAASDDDLPF